MPSTREPGFNLHLNSTDRNHRPTSGNTIDAFKDLAKKASPSTSPPNVNPVGGLRKTSVTVGVGTDLVYSPNNITNSLIGEVIEFSFNPAVSFFSSFKTNKLTE